MGIYSRITGRNYLVMVLASAGALLFGFDNGWWGTVLGEQRFLCDYGSPVTVKGVTSCNLTTPQLSLGSGIQSAGIMVGCAVAMYLNNLIGRKRSLFVTAIVSIIGIVIEMTSAIGGSARFGQFVAGKFICSMSMGLCANIIPVYLSETSVAEARGFVINMYQTVLIIGVLIASGCVYGVSTRADRGGYLIPMGVQLVAPLMILAFGPFVPESPRWLVWMGRHEQAVKSAELLFSNGTNDFDSSEYCNKLAIAFEEERQLATASGWADLFRQPDLRRLLVAIGIQSLQQAQGSSYMNSYIVSFLVGTGVTNVFPVIMGLYCLYFVGICTGYFLPDLFGRRPLLIGTSTFCAITLIVVSILTTVFEAPSTAVQKGSIALIFLWYASFGVQSPLIWIVTAEQAPTRNREKVLGLATFFGFGVSLLITFVAPYISDAGYGGIGSKIGFIWGACSVLNIFFVFFFVPETKGFSLEQLDFLFEKRTATRAFKSYQFADDVLAVDDKVAVEELSAAEAKEKEAHA